MVIVKVNRGKNGRAMVDYPLKEQDYNNDDNPRVRMVSGLNVISEDTAKQEMIDTWRHYGKDDGNYIQAQHIIQSFSNDEADPNSETDVYHAHFAGCELVHRLYPEHQAIVVTHADNTDGGTKNAMVHNHIVVSQVNPETGKSLRAENVGFHRNVAKVNDEVAKDFGYREAINQNPVWENAKKRKERKRTKSDEIIAGVKTVLDKKQVTTMDEYVGALGEFGISVKHKGKRGQNLTHITYNTGETVTSNPGDSRGHGVRASTLAKEILNTMLANAKAEKLKASEVEQKPVVEAVVKKSVDKVVKQKPVVEAVAKKSVDEVVKQKPIIEPIKTKPVAKVVEQKTVATKPVAKVAEQKPVVEVDEETKARNARIAEANRKSEERERRRQEHLKKRREERAARSKTRSKEKNNDGLSK